MLRSLLSKKPEKDLAFCHICLATNMKLFCDPQLQIWYDEIIPPSANSSNMQRKEFCYECSFLLLKSNRFKEKCLKGQKAFEEIDLSQTNDINLKQISMIREKQNFKSNLSSEGTLEIILIETETAEEDMKAEIKTELIVDPLQSVNRRHFIPLQYSEGILFHTETQLDPVNDFNSESSDSSVPDVDKDEAWNFNEDENEDPRLEVEPKVKAPEVKVKSLEEEVKPLKVEVRVKSKSKKKRVIEKKTKSHKVKRKKLSPEEKSDALINAHINLSKWHMSKLTEEQVLIEFNKRAEMPNYKKSPLKCTKCFRGFLRKDTFTRHNMIAHDETKSVVCNICNYRLDNKSKWNVHIFNHLYKFECRTCQYSTCSLSSAKLHQEVHDSERKYICKICSEVFLHASTYYSHLRVTHKSEHLCLLCGKSFVSEIGVRHHMKRTHNVDDSKKAKKRKERLLGALESPDKGSKHYCETCEVTFENELAYEKHFIHSSKHADFKIETNRKSYRYLKKTSRYDPELVKTIVVNKHGLIQGTRSEAFMVLCEICGKYIQNSSLDCHRNSHTHKKMHRCEICQQEFAQKCALNRHMVRHTGVKAFKCELCDKRYTQCGSLKLHVRTAHLNLPYPKRNRLNRKKGYPEIQSTFA